jgi:hypothetical protein
MMNAGPAELARRPLVSAKVMDGYAVIQALSAI